MKNFILKVAVLTSSAILMSGCASIMDGTKQSVSVETPPVKGALCTLQNDKGKWFINSTPGSVTVHRSYKNLIVMCKKMGYTTETQRVKSHIHAALAGNILVGGAIGVGVDTIDGAAYQYPNVIRLPLKK